MENDAADPEAPGPDPGTFGARFLEEWERLGGPLSAWSYAEIQELRASDREGLVRCIRAHQPLTTYAAAQRISTAERASGSRRSPR
jgi:hypothetical protein